MSVRSPAAKAVPKKHGEEELALLQKRVCNWYFKRYRGSYLLCGDRFVEFYSEKHDPIYKFYEYGFVGFEKIVTSGVQCKIMDKSGSGEITIVNCRWDMCDKHFKYTPKKIEKLVKEFFYSKAQSADTISYLRDAELFLVYDEKPTEFVDIE